MRFGLEVFNRMQKLSACASVHPQCIMARHIPHGGLKSILRMIEFSLKVQCPWEYL